MFETASVQFVIQNYRLEKRKKMETTFLFMKTRTLYILFLFFTVSQHFVHSSPSIGESLIALLIPMVFFLFIKCLYTWLCSHYSQASNDKERWLNLALEAITESLKIKPRDPSALLLQGLLHQQNGNAK